MRLLDRFLSKFGYANEATLRAAAIDSKAAARIFKPWLVSTGVPQPSPFTNDIEFALHIPYFFACANHIARSGMGVPLLVRKLVNSEEAQRNGKLASKSSARHCRTLKGSMSRDEWAEYIVERGMESEDVQDNHPLRILLDDVNPEDNWPKLLAPSLFDLEAVGNAYWELSGGKDAGQPTQMWRLRPDRMKVIPDAKTRVGGYLYKVETENEPVRYEREEILHLRYPHALNDYYGQGKVEILRETLLTEWHRIQYGKAFFLHGTKIGGMLTSADGTTPNRDVVTRQLEQFKEQHTGSGNMGKIAYMADMTYTELGHTPKDAEYLNMADRHDTEISAVTGVPMALFKTKEVNRANLEGATRQFWSDTMSPNLMMVEADLNEFLAPRYGDDIFVEFDFSAVKALQEEMTAKAARESVALNDGATSLDEYREALGYEALPDEEGQRYKRSIGARFVVLGEEEEEPVSEEPVPPAPPVAEEPPAEDEAAERGGTFYTRDDILDAEEKAMLPFEFGDDIHTKAYAEWNELIAPHEEALEAAVIDWARALEEEVFDNLAEQAKGFKASFPAPEGFLFDPDEAGEDLWRDVKASSLVAAQAGGEYIIARGRIEAVFDVNDSLVERYLAQKKLKVTTVAKDFHEDLRGRILDGVRAGEGIERISDRIEGGFDNLTGWQATRIAQTETVGAANVGAMAGIKQTGLKKAWIATLDDRVRDTHAIAMSEGSIPQGEVFSNGLAYPGDPAGPAAEVINCRCSLAPVAEGDEASWPRPADDIPDLPAAILPAPKPPPRPAVPRVAGFKALKADEYKTARQWGRSKKQVRRIRHHQATGEAGVGDAFGKGDAAAERKAFEAAMAKGTKWEGSAYRGLTELTDEQYAAYNQLEAGGSFAVDMMSSASKVSAVGEEFALKGRAKANRVLLQLDQKSAIDYEALATKQYAYQREVIVQRGMYQVESVERITRDGKELLHVVVSE